MAQSKIPEIFRHIKNDDLKALEDLLRESHRDLELIGRGKAYILDRTPLMYAIHARKFDIAHFLLCTGANPNYQVSFSLKAGFSILTSVLTAIPWDDSLFKAVLKTDAPESSS